MLNKKALSAAVQAAAAADIYIEDVFAPVLYDGTGSSQTITNGIDLSTHGGVFWSKDRANSNGSLILDNERGITKYIDTTATTGQTTDANTITSFNSDGLTLGTSTVLNGSGVPYVGFAIRQASKFFDVVTYTGNGANRTIAHNLGSIPGCIIVKRTDTTSQWSVYHRSSAAIPQNNYLVLNTNALRTVSSAYWNNTAPTSSVFSLGTNSDVNANGGTYVAYLFAHDASGFGDNQDQNVISCGGYVGTGVTGININLGWEPQFVIIKCSENTGSWKLYNNLSGITYTTNDRLFSLNSTSAEVASNDIDLTSTGFTIVSTATDLNEDGTDFVYIAIRRGPMKTPTDATKVFTPTVYTGTNVDNRLINTTIAPDFVMIRQRNDAVVPGMYTGARLTGQEFLITGSTNAGATDADSFDAQIVSTVEYGNAFSSMSGVWVGNDATRKFNVNTTSNNHIIEAFKRAPGFFDVVCYTGTGANRTVTHNLGVAPEMMIIKSRSAAGYNWAVYHSAIGNTKYLTLNTTSAEDTSTSAWNSTTPTSSVFSLGTDAFVNANTETRIALLFASCPGVSKVGSYTGNGTSQTIDCGFTSGARFVLIKRTNDTGSWFVFDSARGISSGNDPQLKLDSTAAENTGTNFVDTASSGFQVVTSNNEINANGSTYIYLAIA